MPSLYVFVIFLILTGTCAFNRPLGSRILTPCSREMRLQVVEHLADCIGNPKIAEAYGSLGSEYCYQAGGISFADFGELFSRVAFMGLLVSTYYVFQRDGLSEFFDMSKRDAYDTKEEWVTDKENSSPIASSIWSSNQGSISSNKRSMTCPQCGGSGVYDDSGRSFAGPSQCDLCDGLGRVPFTRKVVRPRLPPDSRNVL